VSAPRFFVGPAEAKLASEADIELPPGVVRHAVQVLRLRDGDAIVLFDGRGGEYAATLRIDGRVTRARTARHDDVERESASAVMLVQALVAADVMDTIVQKATELGAAAIVPVVADRSQRVPADRLDKRHLRWHQVAIAACEQCGRNRVPRIEPVVPLAQWIAAQSDLRHVAMLFPRATRALADVASQARAILVGPEGGLTDAEASLVAAAGATPVHLGPRVLRADTAALAGLATLAATQGARG
jgi:16S rRNA (uracil1498-N3)-methyltransferase